ncbi:MAG: succinate dehydrogenase/fumarate reductase iron-sulfur subunit [Verrucomicrobia bacterium]|nr:succinate dehydrogenase/fumarate reductase iron-sulfur subunit [Verrucomicrobiota bacterium]
MAEVRKFKVYRGDKNGGQLTEYNVQVEPGMVVLDGIHQIQRTQAADLACRWNCKAAKCGSCSAEVNGKPRLLCKTRLDDFDPAEIITVRPVKTFPLIRDLVCDVSWNFEVNKKIPPLTPKKTADWVMHQEDMDRVQEFRKCIECFLCQNVCHVLRNHDLKDRFYGPRFMVRIACLEMHPMDGLDRTKLLKDEAGLGFCNITKCCTEVCPEEIHITDNAIIPLKERVADRHYDPLRAFWRKIMGADHPCTCADGG